MPGGAIGFGKVALSFHLGNSRETVVGRVAENDQDGYIKLDVFGGVAFFLQLGKNKALLWASGRLPAGESVCEVNSNSLSSNTRLSS